MSPRARVRPLLRLLVLAAAGAVPLAALAADAGHPAALKACPKVSDEIVDLHTLAEGLKNSKAVGLVEKLRLKSSIDTLIDRFKAYHQGGRGFTLDQLQEQYDLLMMRIAQQLQDKDLPLHGQLCNAWGSIWAALQDRARFTEMVS